MKAAMNPIRPVFLVFMILMIYALTMFALYTLGGKWRLRSLTLFVGVYFVELSHPVLSLTDNVYYPGLITALFFPVIGVLYIIELIRVRRQRTTGCSAQFPEG